MATSLVTRVRRLYGAHPLQLVLTLGSFVVVGYVLRLLGFRALWNTDTWWQSIAVWFVGAALAHDLVLFPAYAVADRVVVTLTHRRKQVARRGSGPPLINFVRVPLLACGLITLMFFPGLIEQGAGTYHRATGQTQGPFLHRWVILCALILLTGLVAYLVARATRSPGADTAAGSSRRTEEDGAGEAPHDEQEPLMAPSTSGWAVLVVAIMVVLAARRRHSRRVPWTTAESGSPSPRR